MTPEYAAWRPLFAEAIDETFFSLAYLDGLIETGRALFWPGEKAAIVTEVKEYPTGVKAVCGVIAAGQMGEIIEVLIPAAEKWGAENGCAYAVIESRYGWQKVLEPSGYRSFQLAVRKAL